MRTDADPLGQIPRTNADSKFRDPHISPACSTFAQSCKRGIIIRARCCKIRQTTLS